MANVEELNRKIDTLKQDVDYLKEHMVDIDTVLTDDDIEALEESKNEELTEL
ncbi:MAG: hypothetical protein ACOCQX_03170 [Candidatus Nanoarchaeia archaeon]